MSSAMVGNGYQQNYNTYNGQLDPNHGQNMQEGYYEPHPSSRPPANEQQYYRSPPPQPQSVQTSPRRGVFYRLVSPEVGLPLGRYEEQRKSFDDQRQRDYFTMMSQKEKLEQQKRQEERLKKQVHAEQVRTQRPEQKLYNYDEVQKSLREERRKDYDEFVKMKEEQSKIKPVPTPPGGLNVGQNDLYRQHLKEELVKEYQASLKEQQKEKFQLQLAKAQQELSSSPLGPAPVLPLPVKPVELFDPEKKEQNPSPRRKPNTPPHGLDIVSQSERTRQAKEKQRLYGQELQKQTQEQMFKKIQNNISVIDRTGQPIQYEHVPPQQHAMPPQQQHAPPSSRNIAPKYPPPQSASSPPPQRSQMLPQATQHTQMMPPQQQMMSPQHPQSPMRAPPLHHTQMKNSYGEHHPGTPAGSHSPPPRQRSHPTPQRTEHGYHPEFNGKQQSPMESRDGHRPPPHPRRHATPDRPDWARAPPRQNGTATGRSSHRENPAPDIFLESYRKKPVEDWNRGKRNQEYNEFLGKKEAQEQSKREQLEKLRRQPAVQPKYDNYSNSDNHERHRKNLDSELRDQYQSFLSKNGEPVYTYTRNPSSDLAQSRLSGGLVGGIFGDVQHEQDRRRVMVQQRNKEYNELKKQSNSREPTEEFNRKVPEQGLPLDNERSNEMRRRQEKVRNREYRKFLEEKVWNHSREEPSQEYGRKVPQMGLPLDNTKSNAMRRQQEKDRNQDYNKFLDEKKRSPRRYHQPTPEDKQGLPLTQRPYDEKKALSEKQRNLEYNQFLAKSGLPYDKMSLQGSVQGSALARQVNGHHSETEPPTPQKRYPSKKHDREVTNRVEEEKKKKKGEVPRRQRDPSLDEKNMFSDMGKSQDAHNRKVKEDARQDYRNYVNHAFPEGLNRGEPTFAARKAPPESWYDAQPPTHRHSPPRDYRPEPEHFQRQSHDAYAERLEQARANEALYRKRDHQMNDSGYRQPPPRQDQAPYALH